MDQNIYLMNIKTTVWLALFMIGICRLSYGQYYTETHRQTTDNINLIRSWNLKTRYSYIEQADNSVPYGVNYYDTGGRVTFMATPMHHEHFMYDDKGRMVYWLDSANDGRRFEKFEYHFGYDDKGVVNVYKTSKTESKFTIVGDQVIEDLSKNGAVIETRIYSYNTTIYSDNNDRKLIQEMDYKDAKDSVGKLIYGKLLYSHKIFYNKYGDVGSEIIYNAIIDCKGDSTIMINTYDSKAKLIHVQKSLKTMKCGSPASVMERKTISESISYTYNAAGQLTQETMTSNDQSLNYVKKYVYNEHGILVREQGFDDKGKSTTDIVYSYVYYPIKRNKELQPR